MEMALDEGAKLQNLSQLLVLLVISHFVDYYWGWGKGEYVLI